MEYPSIRSTRKNTIERLSPAGPIGSTTFSNAPPGNTRRETSRGSGWRPKAGRAEILGFYALNAHSLEGDDLPANLTRNAPRSGFIPAVYLSMIAVDRRRQGQGLGRVLLADALNRAAAAADQIGLKAVVLDVIEDGGPGITEKRRAFYAAMGFQSFPSRPLRMFIGIETIRRACT